MAGKKKPSKIESRSNEENAGKKEGNKQKKRRTKHGGPKQSPVTCFQWNFFGKSFSPKGYSSRFPQCLDGLV